MRTAIFAGAASALALLTPAFSPAATPANYNSGALAVERLEGNGPPLVFIPGLASGNWTWRTDADRLAKAHSG
jgi:pimeloyl-ACP methyl ester carboxylesterase